MDNSLDEAQAWLQTAMAHARLEENATIAIGHALVALAEAAPRIASALEKISDSLSQLTDTIEETNA